LGFVPRSVLLELLGSSDFLVQPGCSNAFNDYRLPSKLPDFLASGRPVILPRTNLGLMVRDGVEALLLDVGDAEEIAAKVAWVLSNPEQAKRIGAAGREFARQMSWENQAARLAAFYEDVLRQPMTNSA
jgi:glycosyltransferase involved in cell wall biosynthesis